MNQALDDLRMKLDHLLMAERQLCRVSDGNMPSITKARTVTDRNIALDNFVTSLSQFVKEEVSR